MTLDRTLTIEVENLRNAYLRLAGLLSSYDRRSRRANETGNRLEVEVESVDFLAWLSAQELDHKVYWRSRDRELEIAGVGVAERRTLSTDDPHTDLRHTLRVQLSDLQGRSRFLGGFRFDNAGGKLESDWSLFGACDFIVPLVELCRFGDRHVLALNIPPGAEVSDPNHVREVLERLVCPDAGTPDSSASLLTRHDIPDRGGWGTMASSALSAIEEKSVRKIVLARKSVFEFSQAVDPWRLLSRLRQSSDLCFLFGRQIPGDSQNLSSPLTFISASPERLYRRTGTSLETEAIAGTRPRGLTSSEDERLGQELMASGKDQMEQNLVVTALINSLGQFAEVEGVDGSAQLLKLDRVQHLLTRLKATITNPIADWDIVTSLHPTPAVGGTPTDRALAIIRQLEPFDRGWYAAPIGWIGQDGAEFAVGIRSALVSGSTVSVYSGAGLVEGSTAEGEWREIEHKIGAFTRPFML